MMGEYANVLPLFLFCANADRAIYVAAKPSFWTESRTRHSKSTHMD